MSNTSTVTPYDSVTTTSESSNSTSSGADALASCVAGAAAIAQWLMEETPEEAERLRKFKKMRSAEFAQRITTVGLHLSSPESLVASARRLGYKVELSSRTPPSSRQQTLLLSNVKTGERLAIARGNKGKLVVSAAGESHRVHHLISQHTIDRAVHHFKSRGMSVETARLPNGEVQIMAREQGAQHSAGAASVKTKVGADGRTIVDVDCVSGNRCENIVRDFAKAVGGQVTTMTKKHSYYQLPGEPTKPRVKV